MRRGSAWHRDIRPILEHLDPTVTGSVDTLAENLRSFDLKPDPGRSAQSLRRESEAREQLALDLTLSSDVFSSQPFVKAANVDDALETMTESLSLSAEPPSVDFRYLKPVPKPVDHYSRDEQESELQLPLGVRLLLKDWDIGADPERFTYRDPYGTEEPSQRAASPPRVHVPASQPPLVIAANTVPPAVINTRAAPSMGQSQPTVKIPFSTSQATESPPQFLMTSTQVLPGPFGGRQNVKKKVPKKRMGGF